MKKHKLYLYILLVFYYASAETSFDEPLDLTWDVHEKTARLPTSRPFVFSRKSTEISDNGDWYAQNEFCVGERVGTHLDAPYHFNQYGWKVGDIPISRLIANGVTINMLKIIEFIDMDTLLLPDHIRRWEWLNGDIYPGYIVLIKFGWYLNYGTKKYMYNETNELNFPAISKEAAEYLVDRKVLGVGIDTPAVDRDKNAEAQRLLAENNIYVMANINFTSDVPEKHFKLFVMPMKIRAGSAAPLRLVAVPENRMKLLKVISQDIVVPKTIMVTKWITHCAVVLCSVSLLVMYTVFNACNSVL